MKVLRGAAAVISALIILGFAGSSVLAHDVIVHSWHRQL